MTPMTYLLGAAGIILGSFLVGGAAGLVFEARRRSPGRLLIAAAITAGFGGLVTHQSFALATGQLRTDAWGEIGLAVLIAIGGLAVLTWGRRWDRPRGRLRCPQCWYDMSGHISAAACPECGRTIGGEADLRRTRTNRAVVWLGAIVATIGLVGGVVSLRNMESWARALPNTALILLSDHDLGGASAVSAELNRRTSKGTGQAGVYTFGASAHWTFTSPTGAIYLPWSGIDADALADWQWSWLASRIRQASQGQPHLLFVLAGIPHPRAETLLREAVANGEPGAGAAWAARLAREPEAALDDALARQVLQDPVAYAFHLASRTDDNLDPAEISARCAAVSRGPDACLLTAALDLVGRDRSVEADALRWRWIDRGQPGVVFTMARDFHASTGGIAAWETFDDAHRIYMRRIAEAIGDVMLPINQLDHRRRMNHLRGLAMVLRADIAAGRVDDRVRSLIAPEELLRRLDRILARYDAANRLLASWGAASALDPTPAAAGRSSDAAAPGPG